MKRGADPTARARDTRGTVREVAGWLRRERWRIVVSVVLAAVSVAASVAGPALLGRATDVIYTGVLSQWAARFAPAGTSLRQAAETARAAGQPHLADMLGRVSGTVGAGIDWGALTRVLVLVGAAYAVAAVSLWVGGMLLRTAIHNTGRELRSAVQRKIDRLPFAYLDRHARGDVLSRVTNDVDNVTQTLQQTLSQLFTSVLQAVGIVVMMLVLSWRLALIALAIVPFTGWIAGMLMKRAKPYFGRQWQATGDVSATVEESFSGAEVAALYGLHDQQRQDFATTNRALYDASFRAQFLSGLMQPVMTALSNLSYVCVALVGALLVVSGRLTLGSVQAFLQYSRQFTQPLSTLASVAALMQSGIASAERIFDLLRVEEMTPEEASGEEPTSSRVVFEHVAFGYEPDVPVIRDFSLAVEPGQMVAIVGPTGAGKTTLVNLLMRFYEVDAGHITVGGVDVRDMTRETLRARIGMVLQDTWLRDDTIRANIAYGREDSTMEEVEEAARVSGVDQFARSMREGLDTPVDNEGDRLSAGQKQLVTIARAFVADPQILIMDEATSSVDTRTEALIQEAMAKLRKGRTSFVIAHRLSTIRDADVIVVMAHGDVVEQGTHTELLAADGTYAELYRSQFAETRD